MTAPDTRFTQRARELYDRAARQLDPSVSARLHSARLNALAAAHEDGRRHARTGARWLLPGGAFAVIVLAAVTLWQPLQPSRMETPTSAMAGSQGSEIDNDLPPDAAQTDPKLYQNLDFYGWLASTDSTAGGR
ncbi:MAG: hypothetical protein ABI379_11050 [Rhodanobacter sp.]